MKTLLFSALVALCSIEGEVATPSAKAITTPATLRVERALDAIGKAPDHPRAYTQLAWALSRRARETADPEYYGRARQAAGVALLLRPKDAEARKATTWALLGEHRFREALDQATALQRDIPDDVIVYGLLVDAHVELGNYAAAEEACQWMLDLRPGNTPALLRAAYLREIFGDEEGALDLLGQAFHRTPPRESEDRAWILTQIGNLHQSVGRSGAAGPILEEALGLFPDYHYALSGLAEQRRSQGNLPEAIELLRRHVRVAPHPENVLVLARALLEAGEEDEARALFAEAEAGAAAESGSQDNANRELALYYADIALGCLPSDLPRTDSSVAPERAALELARAEYARRSDIFTREALAWALHAQGDDDEAWEVIAPALETGSRSARLLCRAGAIAHARGAVDEARRLLEAGLERAPGASLTSLAEELLGTEGGSTPSRPGPSRDS